MELADDRKLPGIESDRTLAADPTFPSFALKPIDCARLLEIINAYGPYSNGETAVFWHIVGVIGSHRSRYVPSLAGGGPCVHCGEWTGMHYQTSGGDLLCVQPQSAKGAEQ